MCNVARFLEGSTGGGIETLIDRARIWKSPGGGQGIGGLLRIFVRPAALMSEISVSQLMSDDPSCEGNGPALDCSFEDDRPARISPSAESHGHFEYGVWTRIEITNDKLRIIHQVRADFVGEILDYGSDVISDPFVQWKGAKPLIDRG
jgi:hypothetical protein